MAMKYCRRCLDLINFMRITSWDKELIVRWEERKRALQKTDAFKEKQRQSQKNWLSNPRNRVSAAMSHTIRRGLKTGKMGLSWRLMVPWSLDELCAHLESQFTDGMSWDNYGEWHIDHIIPVAAFNFSSTEDIDFQRCWALENLQPLWGKENSRKGATLNKPFQPMLSFPPGRKYGPTGQKTKREVMR